MKRFEPFTLNRDTLPRELEALRQLLHPADRELSEQNDILPFFKSHGNLASLLGFYAPHLACPDVQKFEFPVVGDHACDLAVGEVGNGQFCFIEFEDARRNSIFQRGSKGTPDWAARLEHGFSQLVDWFYRLADQSQTGLFREFFGTSLANYCGLLVIGRDEFLTPAEHERLRWRSQSVNVAGKAVSIITFDQLYQNLAQRVALFSPPPTQQPGTISRRIKKTKKGK